MCLARLAVPRPTVVYGRFACEYVAAADAISVGGKYWHVRTVAAHVTSEFFAKPMAITAGRRRTRRATAASLVACVRHPHSKLRRFCPVRKETTR